MTIPPPNTPLFTIVIPAYNKAPSISATILSVKQQIFTDWEVVIIDDGSSDNTQAIVETFLSDRRIVYHKKDNGGVCSARNLGVTKAQGEYLLFLDADDTALPNWLNTFNDLLQSGNFDLMYCGVSVNKNGALSETLPQQVFLKKVGIFLAGTFCVKKKIFEGIGGYDELITYGENYELGFRLCCLPLKTAFVSELLISYNISGNDRADAYSEKRIASNLRVFEKYKMMYHIDRKFFSLLFAITGYLYARKKEKKIARYYFRAALRQRPYIYKNWLRLFKTYL
ncbi:MAG: glycosyltransferase family 2 protein [Filimonas sp.]|nr:glycosyltransferase family 2 protein [Filimonas sp.]